MNSQTTGIVFAILVTLAFIVIFLLAANSMMKQSAKDWAVYEDFEKRMYLLKGKEEIEAFHKEFVEAAQKIHNPLINPKLSAIDGYVRGLYQQYKQQL